MKLELIDFSLYTTKEREKELLHCDSLSLESGNVNVIKAPSGWGKTSLINAICGENQNYEGEISLDGKPLSVRGDSFYQTLGSYVTSDGCFIPDLTIAEQFSLVSDNQEEIHRLTNLLSLDALKNKRIAKCSRGEQKRIEIATALLKNLPILLLDEPTANLDQKNSVLVFHILNDYAKSHLVIVASHEEDVLGEECNLYSIQDGEIVLTRASAAQKSEEAVGMPKADSHTHSERTLRLFSLRKAFKSTVSLCLSILFSFLFLVGTFFSLYLVHFDQKKTYLQGIENHPAEYIHVYMEDSVWNEATGPENLFASTSLSCGGDFLNVATLEDLSGDLKASCQKIFDAFQNPYTDSEKIYYYPILITTNQQTFFRGTTNSSLEVGSIFPASFEVDRYAGSHSDIQDRLVVAGVMDPHEAPLGEEGTSLPDSFPAIVRKQDYLSCLRHTGIRSETITTSLLALLSGYKDYCEKNGIDYALKDNEIRFASLIPYSTVKDRMKQAPGNVVPWDGNIYYTGDLPTQKNWMMFPLNRESDGPLDEIYSKLEEDSYFQKYVSDGKLTFPLADPFQELNLTSTKTFALSGYYLQTGDEIGMKDTILISDALFEEMSNIILGSTVRKDYVTSKNLFVSKQWLKDNIGLYFDNEVSKDENKVLQTSDAYWEKLRQTIGHVVDLRTFIEILTLIVCLISILFSSLYFINLQKSFLRDFAVLKLLGVSGKEQSLTLFRSYLPGTLIAYFLALGFSQLISDALLKLTAGNSALASALTVSSVYTCYLLQMAALIVLFGLSFVFALLHKRKTASKIVKES